MKFNLKSYLTSSLPAGGGLGWGFWGWERLLFCLLALTLTACGGDDNDDPDPEKPFGYVTSLAFTQPTLELNEGDAPVNVTFEATPEGVELLGSIQSSSSDKSVCTVAFSGETSVRITPVGAGTATITIASILYPDVKATLDVTVTAKDEDDKPEPKPDDNTGLANGGRIVAKGGKKVLMLEVVESREVTSTKTSYPAGYTYIYENMDLQSRKGSGALKRIYVYYATSTLTSSLFDFTDPARVVCTHAGDDYRMGNADAVYDITYTDAGLIASLRATPKDGGSEFLEASFTYGLVQGHRHLKQAKVTANDGGTNPPRTYTFDFTWKALVGNTTGLTAVSVLTETTLASERRTYEVERPSYAPNYVYQWTPQALTPLYATMLPLSFAKSFDWLKAFAYAGLLGEGPAYEPPTWNLSFEQTALGGTTAHGTWAASTNHLFDTDDDWLVTHGTADLDLRTNSLQDKLDGTLKYDMTYLNVGE